MCVKIKLKSPTFYIRNILIFIKAIIYFTHLAFLGGSSYSHDEGSTILYCNDHNDI